MNPKAKLTLLIVLNVCFYSLCFLASKPWDKGLSANSLFGRWSQGVWEGGKSSKRHCNEQIIAVSNWGSILLPPPYSPLETIEHTPHLLHRRPDRVLHWFRVALRYINFLSLLACPALPCGQKKPQGREIEVFVFETGKRVQPSCKWPLGWGAACGKGTSSFCYICFRS